MTSITMPSIDIDISELAFAPLSVSAKGAKQLPALYKNGEPVVLQPSDALTVPFEPSAFNDPEASRVTLCMNATEAVCEQIKALDEWCIATLADNPTNLIGTQLSLEQIQDRYVSCLKTSEKYQTLRTKLNRVGRCSVICYTPAKEKRDQPAAWRDVTIQPRIVFKGLWLMGRDFGPILETTHVMIHKGDADECPF
jgi:hypothetical protein